MKLARFQNTTGTSLSSAYTQPVLRSNPIQRSVRRQRPNIERSVSDVVREGNYNVQKISQITNLIGGVATHIADKVEQAEFDSQFQKAITSYQTGVASIRADQMSQPVAEFSEDGTRTVLSDNFAEDYQNASTGLVDEIFNNGLDNRRAQALFEQERRKIDQKHLGDIQKFNAASRIQVAKADSLEALDKAVTKGSIQTIVQNMANNGLIKFSEAPALTEKYVQDLNFRKSMLGVAQINNLSGDTRLNNDAFYSETQNQYNSAYTLLVGGELTKEQFTSINSQIRTAEDNREKLITQQQDLNNLGMVRSLITAKANGQDTSQFVKNALNGSLVDSVGADNALALMKAAESVVEDGAQSYASRQGAANYVYSYEEGSITFEDAQKALADEAPNLGNDYFRLSERLTAARKNQVNVKNAQGGQMIDTIVASTYLDVDRETGNLNREALQAKEVLRTRLALAIQQDPQTDPSKWVVNTVLNELSIPDYLGNTDLMNADVGKGKKFVTDRVKSLEDDFDQYLNGIFQTSDGRSVTGIDAWAAAENQMLDEISSMRMLLQDSTFRALVSDPLRYGINE